MLRYLWITTVVLPAIFVAPASTTTNKGTIWAVLVASTYDYMNYRHQADVCHAYQILHSRGIPDSNIITMMYDDIANNAKNPKKGYIFNKPNGTNVYENMLKDYTGNDVTAINFLNVLTGNAKAMAGVGSGKVLKSGPNDHVFVNLVGHGARGFVSFPRGRVYADLLMKAFMKMAKRKKFKKLLIYLESCESGSMFRKILPHNIGVFATTAADPHECSYACYWDDDLQTYLGDEYSVAWMEDCDDGVISLRFPQNLFVDNSIFITSEFKCKVKFTLSGEIYEKWYMVKNSTHETVHNQFINVKNHVQNSNPEMYGQKQLQKDLVSNYIGCRKNVSYLDINELQSTRRFQDSVSSQEVPLETLNRKFTLAKNVHKKEDLEKKKDELVRDRQVVDLLFRGIMVHVTELNISEVHNLENSHADLSLKMMPCYRTLVNNFSDTCVDVNKNTYTLGHLYKFANLCLSKYSSKKVLEAFEKECGDQHRALREVH